MNRKHKAAAMAEIALLLSLVAIIIIGALAWQGEWAGGIFGEVSSSIKVGP